MSSGGVSAFPPGFIVPVMKPVFRAEVKSTTSSVLKQSLATTLDFVKEYPTTSAVIGSTAGLGLAYLFREKLRRVSYRVRGIQGESARAGSCIVRDDKAWPQCQVLLYEAGALWSTFIGCGVRVGDILVTYSHVVKGVEKLVVRTKKGYFLINAGAVSSSRLTDVSYFQLTPAEWSRMGVTSANRKAVPEQMALRAQPALVWSKEGYTQGTLAPLNLGKMKMEYSGTTEPGFSGAPYMGGPNNSQVLGLHQGVQDEHNVGYIWFAILEDVKKTFYSPDLVGEAKKPFRSGGDDQGKADMAAQYLRPTLDRGAWSYRGLQSQIEQMEVGDSGWAEEDDFDWNQTFEAAPTTSTGAKSDVDEIVRQMENMSQGTLEAVRAMADGLISKKRVMIGQSPDSPKIDGGSTLVEVVSKGCNAYTDAKIAELEKRVAALEESRKAAEASVEGPKREKGPAPKYYSIRCAVCNKGFSTDEGLLAHQAIKGHRAERASHTFLGGKKPSHYSGKSKSGSTSVDRFPPSQPNPVNTESLEGILRTLATSLDAALKGIAGQKPAPEQN